MNEGIDRDNGGRQFTDVYGVRVDTATAFRLRLAAGGSIELVTTRGQPTVLIFGQSRAKTAISLDLTVSEVQQLAAALIEEGERLALNTR